MNNTFKKRIDELGRIVIPKQIRNTFKINNFDELELYTENDNIVIKKTGGILAIKDKLNNFLNYIKKYNGINAFILDKNTVIASNIPDVKNTVDIDSSMFLNNQEYLEMLVNKSFYLKGYIKSYQLIYDSNLYGSIVFVLDNKLDGYGNQISDIVTIIMDYFK